MNRAALYSKIALAISPLLLILAACCGGDGNQEKGTGKTMGKWHVSEECDFAKLDTGPLDENPCSPQIDDPDFQGIVLNGPEEVLYDPGETVAGSSAFADVRVCGTCCFEFGFMGLQGKVQGSVLMVAVDASTQETFSGKLVTIQNPVAPPDAAGQGGGPTEGLLVESYFNPNLVETLGLPERPAEYIVYAVLGEIKSNTVRILVKERS